MTRASQIRTIGRFTAAALCAAVAATSVATSAQAAQIGQQCRVGALSGGAVVSSVEGAYNRDLYVIGPGDWFRIEGWGTTGEYYFGHAAGKANGYIYRPVFDQSTCKF